MGQKRLIDTDILSSEDLIDLPATERWIWLGCILHADRSGILRASSRHIRALTLHGLRCSVARTQHTLDIFVARSMLTRCNLGGVSCYKITNFKKYQRFKRKTESKYDQRSEVKRSEVKRSEVKEVHNQTPVETDSEDGIREKSFGVADHYQALHTARGRKDSQRWAGLSTVDQRIMEGYSVEDLKLAVDRYSEDLDGDSFPKGLGTFFAPEGLFKEYLSPDWQPPPKKKSREDEIRETLKAKEKNGH